MIIESEKLPIHDSLVGLMVELQSNRWQYKYIIYILFKNKANGYLTPFGIKNKSENILK